MENDWLAWVEQAEELIGQSAVEADEEQDGWSIGGLYDAWVDGDSPETAANRVLRTIAKRCHPAFR